METKQAEYRVNGVLFTRSQVIQYLQDWECTLKGYEPVDGILIGEYEDAYGDTVLIECA